MAKKPETGNSGTSDEVNITSQPQFPDEENVNQPEAGIALSLSGGGYRAMLFHVGALLRLNELTLLQKLSRVSSVSGGSITAAVLGLNWKNLIFDNRGVASNLKQLLVEPIQKMASTTIDRGSILRGVLLPGSVSDRIVGYYREVLYGEATLQDLPPEKDDPAAANEQPGPRFVINATSVQSGALVRMSRPYLADYRVGMILSPTISLAEAVAASSAFPPFLSPAEIDVDPSDFESDNNCDLQREPFTDTLVLTDGGVYDNFGMETVWKRYQTILISDGGGKMQPDPSPAGDWAQHSKRILDIIDNQVRSLRKRQLIDSYKAGVRDGAYWGIRTDLNNYRLADALPAKFEDTLRLADTPTRLKRLPETRQEQLINWGYAVADAALRKHCAELIPDNPDSPSFPFESGLA